MPDKVRRWRRYIFCVCPKTAELLEIPFGLWTWVGPRNHVGSGSSPDLPCKGASFRGNDMPEHAEQHSSVSSWLRERCKNARAVFHLVLCSQKVVLRYLQHHISTLSNIFSDKEWQHKVNSGLNLIFGRPFVKRFPVRHQTLVCLSCLGCLTCLRRWCTMAERLDGSIWILACR